MVVQEARRLTNQEIDLRWRDRDGSLNGEVVFVYQLQFIPFYGPCLITSAGEIHIELVDSAIPLMQHRPSTAA